MAVRRLAEQQPPSFEFTPANLEWAKAKIRDYPDGRQASAVIPILWKAQEQHHGWLPEPAIRLVADMLNMPYIRVFEVATFYTMFQLQPVGSVAHIGVCGTTPCMLRGSDDIVALCRHRIADHPFELSEDGRFSWEEVECAGACVNAPMVQIGPDTFEDLTADSFGALLDTLAEGGTPTPGPQSARRGSEPLSGATTLRSPRKDSHSSGSEAPSDGAPDADVSPQSPAAGGENAARPGGSDRADVEATRGGGGGEHPVAPDPQSSGQTARGPDAPEKQQRADASADDAGSASAGAGDEIETQTATPSDAEADRAAPGASAADRPVDADAARIEPSAAHGDTGTTATDTPAANGHGASAPAAKPHPPAPDTIASTRADAVGERPRSLSREDLDEVDDLQKISGIGPVIKKTLHGLGIFTFRQIAEWNDANKEWVNAYLAFKGRIDRERWVEQAREMAEGDGDTSA